MTAKRLYQTLLRLYPADFKASFAAEMLDTFARAAGDRRARGRLRYARFVLSELAGLAIAIPAEWFARASPRPAVAGHHDESIAPEKQLKKIISLMEHAIANHDFPKARFYSELERAVRERLQHLEESRGSE